mgnify:CR=1 FL=1
MILLRYITVGPEVSAEIADQEPNEARLNRSRNGTKIKRAYASMRTMLIQTDIYSPLKNMGKGETTKKRMAVLRKQYLYIRKT